MEQIKTLGLAAFFMASFLGCGPKKSEPPKRGVYINNINRTPIELYKQYPECSAEEAVSDSPFFFVEQFVRGTPFSRNVDMSPGMTGGQLKGFQIEQTYYDAEMMLEKRISGGRLVGLDFFVTNEPKPMNVCPGVKDYDRYSYENASMSAVYSIGKTVSKLRDVGFSPGRGVKVFVSPYTIERRIVELEDRVLQEELRITDNAYYFPHLSAVVFMPQSEESRDGTGFGNVPLWEVPMVGSHEYGHHVFHKIMTSAGAQLSSYHHSCFGQAAVKIEAANLERPKGLRLVSSSDVLASLNEGFADLVSFYTLDEGERGLEGVVCMEDSREVSSPVFANEEEKLFSPKVMETFLSEQRTDSAGCYTPDFQQIHIVGAVFASVSERLMNEMGHGKEMKLSLILKWLEEMNKFHTANSRLDPEKYLLRSYSLMAAVSMQASDLPPASECEIAEKYMPFSEHSEKELSALGCR